MQIHLAWIGYADKKNLFYIRTTLSFFKLLAWLGMAKFSQNLIGERLKEARAKAQLTQEELSKGLKKSGVSIDRAGIAKIESGIRGVLDIELVALAKAVNVKVSWLLGIKE